eukprot:35796-Chlamydomonas_euryale.AAC.1
MLLPSVVTHTIDELSPLFGMTARTLDVRARIAGRGRGTGQGSETAVGRAGQGSETAGGRAGQG